MPAVLQRRRTGSVVPVRFAVIRGPGRLDALAAAGPVAGGLVAGGAVCGGAVGGGSALAVGHGGAGQGAACPLAGPLPAASSAMASTSDSSPEGDRDCDKWVGIHGFMGAT